MKDSNFKINISVDNKRHKKETNVNKSDISNEEKDYLIEQNYKYFIEYSKLFNTNELLKDRLKELIKEKNELKTIINKLYKKDDKKEINDSYTKRKV